MNSVDNPQNTCTHTPSKKGSNRNIFFDFFIHQNTLIDKETNTARCAYCGKRIATPRFFSHLGLKFLFFLLTTAMELVCYWLTSITKKPLMFLLWQLIVCIVIFVIVRLTNALVFTFGQWSLETETSILLLTYRNTPKKHSTFSAVMAGFLLAQILSRIIFF